MYKHIVNPPVIYDYSAELFICMEGSRRKRTHSIFDLFWYDLTIFHINKGEGRKQLSENYRTGEHCLAGRLNRRFDFYQRRTEKSERVYITYQITKVGHLVVHVLFSLSA